MEMNQPSTPWSVKLVYGYPLPSRAKGNQKGCCEYDLKKKKKKASYDAIWKPPFVPTTPCARERQCVNNILSLRFIITTGLKCFQEVNVTLTVKQGTCRCR